MAYVLIVNSDFGPYRRGDRISDPAEMERVLLTHELHVIRARAAEDPAPAADPEPRAA